MADKWIQLQSADGIDNLFPIGKVDLLWTNSAPTSSFSAQTVPLDLSKYRFAFITFKWGTDSARAMLNSLIKVESDTGGLIDDLYNARIYREFLVALSGVEFKAGYYAVNFSTSMGQNNAYAIPYQIFGIK